jgi:hypothetical protein
LETVRNGAAKYTVSSAMSSSDVAPALRVRAPRDDDGREAFGRSEHDCVEDEETRPCAERCATQRNAQRDGDEQCT